MIQIIFNFFFIIKHVYLPQIHSYVLYTIWICAKVKAVHIETEIYQIFLL